MDSTGPDQLVRAKRRSRSEQRRAVLVMGKQPIDRIFAVSGAVCAFETAADPATLDLRGHERNRPLLPRHGRPAPEPRD